jgi:hypothetical protein
MWRMQTAEDKGTHRPNPSLPHSAIDTLQCSGGTPCEACAARNSPCDYDVSSDQRRKIANQRNVQELAQAQNDLHKTRQLLGGIIAILRAANTGITNDLIHLIRADTDLSSIAAYVRNEVRANPSAELAFQSIDFYIDGNSDLPSPAQLLSRLGGRSLHLKHPIRAEEQVAQL